MTIKLKSAEEIEIMREGGRRHAEILRQLSNLVKVGVSSFALEKEAVRLIEEGGDQPAFLGYQPEGAKRPFPAALCLSVNEEIVHGIPNERERLQELLRSSAPVSLVRRWQRRQHSAVATPC